MTSKWRSSVLRVASRLEELDYFSTAEPLQGRLEYGDTARVPSARTTLPSRSTRRQRGFRVTPGGERHLQTNDRSLFSAPRPTTKAAYIEGLENGELRLDSTKVRESIDRSRESAATRANGSWKAALPGRAGRFGEGGSSGGNV